MCSRHKSIRRELRGSRVRTFSRGKREDAICFPRAYSSHVTLARLLFTEWLKHVFVQWKGLSFRLNFLYSNRFIACWYRRTRSSGALPAVLWRFLLTPMSARLSHAWTAWTSIHLSRQETGCNTDLRTLTSFERKSWHQNIIAWHLFDIKRDSKL